MLSSGKKQFEEAKKHMQQPLSSVVVHPTLKEKNKNKIWWTIVEYCEPSLGEKNREVWLAGMLNVLIDTKRITVHKDHLFSSLRSLEKDIESEFTLKRLTPYKKSHYWGGCLLVFSAVSLLTGMLTKEPAFIYMGFLLTLLTILLALCQACFLMGSCGHALKITEDAKIGKLGSFCEKIENLKLFDLPRREEKISTYDRTIAEVKAVLSQKKDEALLALLSERMILKK